MAGEILDKRDEISTSFNDAIAKTKSAIKILKENNAIDEVKKLEGNLSKLINEYSSILNDLDDAVKDIYKQKRETILSLNVS